MPDGDLPRLAAFLRESQRVLAAVVTETLQGELGDGADAGGGVDEDGEDRPVAEADNITDVDRLQQPPGLARLAQARRDGGRSD
jgi:hypothetical protein